MVHYRSKTILFVVHQEEDVAPVAAMCALMGDHYRHRQFFAKEPMTVLRVAVIPSLYHHFVRENQIVSWRAHESSAQGSRWTTNVGSPDSIWILRDEGDSRKLMNGLVEAFRGQSLQRPDTGTFLSHDDGGMADMILFGNSSSLTLPMWQQIAALSFSNSTSNTYQYDAPPLVIATVGSLRGQDLLSRMAFAGARKQNRRQRPLALVGFPELLWTCRLVSASKVFEANKIKTRLARESSIVIVIGRDSASLSRQDVSLVPNTLASAQHEWVLRLLRQTIFLPKTELQIGLQPTLDAESFQKSSSTKYYLYNLLWTLMQDPLLVQFPCCLALQQMSYSNESTRFSKETKTLGALVLSVFEELLQVLYAVHGEIKKSTSGVGRDCYDLDDYFCKEIAHPLKVSLLVKLLGTGGVLVEDLSNNRMAEILIRLKLTPGEESKAQAALIKQRWILEPLLTRSALSEWQYRLYQSPYPPVNGEVTSDPVLIRQLKKDCIQYGLGLILQLSELVGMNEDRVSTLRWVVTQCYLPNKITSFMAEKDVFSAVPLKAWAIETVEDLQTFLTQNPPLGVTNPTEAPLLSKL